MQVWFDVPATMTDGTVLVADVWLPDGDGAFPTLLQRVPYDRGAPGIRDGALDVVQAVRRGYAVVTQDCRGRFGSGGDFVPFEHEASDGVDTIAWIREQPWCDGKIGMFGRSYSALVQWQVAAQNPPGLLAIAPMFSGTNAAIDWFGLDGSLEWGFLVVWTLRHLVGDAVRRTGPVDAVAAADRIANDIGPVLAETAGGNDILTICSAIPWLEEWFSDDQRAGAFERISGASAAPYDVSVPAFVTAGWFDIFLNGTLRAARGLGGPGSLLIGPWPHGGNNSGVFPEFDFGPAASAQAIGLTGRQLAWFDRWLCGCRAGTVEPATWFHRGRGWQTGDEWPPADADTTVLHLAGRGLLSVAAAGPGARLLQYDQANPAPTLGGTTFLPGLEVVANAGPRDQQELLDRDDVLSWFTEPLKSELDVVGHVWLKLHTDAAPGVRVVVRLVEAGIDGRIMLVGDGAATLNHGPTSVALSPIAWTFPPGSRVGVLLSNTSVPRYRRWATDHPGDIPAQGALRVSTKSTLYLGGPYQSTTAEGLSS